jgi:hypothetical protein
MLAVWATTSMRLVRHCSVAADHYVYALTDYREADRSIALARCSHGAVPVLSQAKKIAA